MKSKILVGCLLVASCADQPDAMSDGKERTFDHAGAVETETETEASDEAEEEAEPPAAEGQPLTYYRDVKPILDSKCGQCHVAGGMAPFALSAYEQVAPLAKGIESAVTAGRMPPWSAAGPLDKYIGDRRLTDAQKATIQGWVAQGAPAGDPKDEPPAPPKEQRGLSRVDYTLPMPEAYTPGEDGEDDYRCFALPLPNTARKYITGMGIVPSNVPMVHHAVLYLVPARNAEYVRGLDAEDPGPGWECFGGVTAGSWLSSYEPGGFGQDTPDGIGFEVQPGAMFILQMHYNTHHGKGPDLSKVEVKVEDQVKRVGRVPQIMNYAWTYNMRIPANNPDYAVSWSGRPGQLASDKTYEIYTADLHMHTLGRSGSIYIVRGRTGRRETLLDIPRWAFAWQETFRLQKPVRLNPEDKLGIECHYDNTQAKQPEREVKVVRWGERTEDEMCFGNVIAAEAPPAPTNPWWTEWWRPRPRDAGTPSKPASDAGVAAAAPAEVAEEVVPERAE